MPQLRQNIVTGDWVVVAPERAKRPSDFVTSGMVREDHESDCAFCVGEAAWHTRLRGAEMDTKELYVIPNKYPAFVLSQGHCAVRSFPDEEFYLAKPATGGHEVVILKDHHLLLPQFPQSTMVAMLTMLKNRYAWYRDEADCRPEYTMGIYNYGQPAGASMWHPHAQVFASAIIPNHVAKELHGAEKYFETNGSCVFCDMIAHERTQGVRLQAESAHFTSFTFYAARFPFEVWVAPKVHLSRFELTEPKLMSELATVLRDVLGRYDRTLTNPPLNLFIHSLPNTLADSDSYHWHIELAPRLTTYGGFEMGGSTIIDIVSPEKAAQFLRGEISE